MMEKRVHPACLGEEELLRRCRVVLGKCRGPGGQNRNKVETSVTVIYEPTGAQGYASERRSQKENRGEAVFRLRMRLAVEERGWWSLREVPTELWKSRCGKGGSFAVNAEHEDTPALVAEALDVLSLLKWDVRKAAMLLEVTSSQLMKFLKEHPKAWVMVNQEREKRGAGKLR